ncbi:Uncharacterised protein [Zhongshania aliphaticivorans]|uniref:Fis family transcriptional regulator n=1 Tax=Zhongshania aliphaticivorans TaxID=1470434 RepID=A0A5S9MRP6_9GAMM|nr:Fis family transcriptional regulator [Zhongshania aliphaticivorans]CAA0078817.1 Uncharacterised protein [Zhongshania aliphaticivorans]CAA0086413.1 Uncharacterised protein [Zhongshania aliphaticivorans]
MRKNDKKIDNAIRTQLTEVCEFALDHNNGFLWLTHTVDYMRFPHSLAIRCVFTPETLSAAIQATPLNSLIIAKLNEISINIKPQQISYTLEKIH